MLTSEKLKEVLDYDTETGNFYWKRSTHNQIKVGAIAGGISKAVGYVYIRIDGVKYLAHRLAWLYTYDSWPEAVIDHKNGIKHDNRISNLREVSSMANKQNQRCAQINNKVGFLGVSQSGNKFRARISPPRGKQIHIGLYDTAEEAHEAYLKAKRSLHEGNTI